MRKFNWKIALLSLALAIVLRGYAHAAPNAADPCGQALGDGGYKALSVNVNASTNSAQQLVALISGMKIYVCAYYGSTSGTAPTVTFEYGTGTNCGTGTTILTGPITLATGSIVQSQAFEGTQLVIPAGNALCTLLGGTTPTYTGFVSYRQGP